MLCADSVPAKERQDACQDDGGGHETLSWAVEETLEAHAEKLGSP